MTLVTLNTVWKFAICLATLPGVRASSQVTIGKKVSSMKNITVPIVLKLAWIIAARLESVVAPRLASTAVMQVPMLQPSTTYTALPKGMRPWKASACRMPIDTEELWMMLVTTSPVSMPTTGLWKFTMNCLKDSISRSGSTPEEEGSYPGRVCQPASISPTRFTDRF